MELRHLRYFVGVWRRAAFWASSQASIHRSARFVETDSGSREGTWIFAADGKAVVIAPAEPLTSLDTGPRAP